LRHYRNTLPELIAADADTPVALDKKKSNGREK